MKIIWDLGGVLLHWQPLQLLREVLPARAPDEAAAAHWRDAIFQSFGGDWGEFDRGSVEPDELARRIARRSGLGVAEAAAVIAAVPPHLQPLPQAVALLDALAARGFEQHYLSNMPRPYAEHIEREHDFFDRFASGLFSARVGLCKPQPELFALAEQRFGLEAPRTLFIDDHAGNVEAARSRGWQALLAQDSGAIERGLRERGLL